MKGSFAIPLLERIQVLAIEDDTVFTAEAAEKTSQSLRRDSRNMVTLMVSSTQAQALQLALAHGSIMLAMRNPLDVTRVVSERTKFSQLILLDPPVGREEKPLGPATAEQPEAGPELPAPPATEKRKQYEMKVIRGSATEIIAIPLHGST